MHWQRVLHLLGLDAQQRRDTLAARRLLLDNMGKLLVERQLLAQQLVAAQPSAMEYIHFTKVSLQVGGRCRLGWYVNGICSKAARGGVMICGKV